MYDQQDPIPCFYCITLFEIQLFRLICGLLDKHSVSRSKYTVLVQCLGWNESQYSHKSHPCHLCQRSCLYKSHHSEFPFCKLCKSGPCVSSISYCAWAIAAISLNTLSRPRTTRNHIKPLSSELHVGPQILTKYNVIWIPLILRHELKTR